MRSFTRMRPEPLPLRSCARLAGVSDVSSAPTVCGFSSSWGRRPLVKRWPLLPRLQSSPDLRKRRRESRLVPGWACWRWQPEPSASLSLCARERSAWYWRLMPWPWLPGALVLGVLRRVGVNYAPNGHRAWGSFSGFKSAMGPAGPGKEWHHIIEQTPGNVTRFGGEALHNTENVIALDKALHGDLSTFFSSIRPGITRSATLTVRQWVSAQSYEAQRQFGLLAIENVRNGIWR